MARSPEFYQVCWVDFVPLLPCYLTECLPVSKCVLTELEVSLDDRVDLQTERCLRGVNTDVDVSMVSTSFPHSRKSPLKSRMC